jgi:hypothetical protein
MHPTPAGAEGDFAMPAAVPPLFRFIDAYHLWWVILLLSTLGVYELASIGILLWYRLLGDHNEAYYSYKIRCSENRNRYDKACGQEIRSIQHRSAGD